MYYDDRAKPGDVKYLSFREIDIALHDQFGKRA